MNKTLKAAFALLLTLVMALTGCSTNESSTDNSSSEASSEAFPAKIQTKFGEVTVEKAPQRVVALGWGDAEVALSLGVEPVGAADWLAFGGDGIGPWAQPGYTNSPEILGTMELSFEAIAALEPDLILDVKSSGDKERYDKLSEIATTVGIPQGADSWLTSTEDQVTMIGKALGKSGQAEAQLKDLEDQFHKVASSHPSWKGKTVSVATKTSESWGAYLNGDARLEFLKKLGFQQNNDIQALETSSNAGYAVDLSAEQLNKLDADLIVGFPIFIETSAITDDDGWKKIPAVADGRSVVVDGDLANAFSLGTPVAQTWALNQLTPLIEKAAK